MSNQPYYFLSLLIKKTNASLKIDVTLSDNTHILNADSVELEKDYRLQ